MEHSVVNNILGGRNTVEPHFYVPAIYTIFTQSLQKCKRGVLLYLKIPLYFS
jgi:hypothetical protein